MLRFDISDYHERDLIHFRLGYISIYESANALVYGFLVSMLTSACLYFVLTVYEFSDGNKVRVLELSLAKQESLLQDSPLPSCRDSTSRVREGAKGTKSCSEDVGKEFDPVVPEATVFKFSINAKRDTAKAGSQVRFASPILAPSKADGVNQPLDQKNEMKNLILHLHEKNVTSIENIPKVSDSHQSGEKMGKEEREIASSERPGDRPVLIKTFLEEKSTTKDTRTSKDSVEAFVPIPPGSGGPLSEKPKIRAKSEPKKTDLQLESHLLPSVRKSFEQPKALQPQSRGIEKLIAELQHSKQAKSDTSDSEIDIAQFAIRGRPSRINNGENCQLEDFEEPAKGQGIVSPTSLQETEEKSNESQRHSDKLNDSKPAAPSTVLEAPKSTFLERRAVALFADLPYLAIPDEAKKPVTPIVDNATDAVSTELDTIPSRKTQNATNSLAVLSAAAARVLSPTTFFSSKADHSRDAAIGAALESKPKLKPSSAENSRNSKTDQPTPSFTGTSTVDLMLTLKPKPPSAEKSQILGSDHSKDAAVTPLNNSVELKQTSQLSSAENSQSLSSDHSKNAALSPLGASTTGKSKPMLNSVENSRSSTPDLNLMLSAESGLAQNDETALGDASFDSEDSTDHPHRSRAHRAAHEMSDGRPSRNHKHKVSYHNRRESRTKDVIITKVSGTRRRKKQEDWSDDFKDDPVEVDLDCDGNMSAIYPVLAKKKSISEEKEKSGTPSKLFLAEQSTNVSATKKSDRKEVNLKGGAIEKESKPKRNLGSYFSFKAQAGKDGSPNIHDDSLQKTRRHLLFQNLVQTPVSSPHDNSSTVHSNEKAVKAGVAATVEKPPQTTPHHPVGDSDQMIRSSDSSNTIGTSGFVTMVPSTAMLSPMSQFPLAIDSLEDIENEVSAPSRALKSLRETGYRNSLARIPNRVTDFDINQPAIKLSNPRNKR